MTMTKEYNKLDKTFNITPEVVEEETDAYGEGYVLWEDFYIRENENLEKQFYC